jgi:hypothetical protein
MNKKFWVFLILVLIVVGGIYLFIEKSKKNSEPVYSSFEDCDSHELNTSKCFVYVENYDECKRAVKNSTECNKYLRLPYVNETPGSQLKEDFVLEQSFTEILNQVKQEEIKKGIYFSVENVTVFDLYNNTGIDGSIKISCENKLDYNADYGLIQKISNKIITTYPDELGNSSSYKSSVIIGDSCFSEYGSVIFWGIRQGRFGQLESRIIF